MTGKPIELHCDLDVAPNKEPDLVNTFHTVFAPAMSKQPGFVAVTLLKLDSAKAGAAPANASHRLVISFETEQQSGSLGRDRHAPAGLASNGEKPSGRQIHRDPVE